jgi:hypothetical protein
MAGVMTKNRIQSDILEWSLPEEMLSVLLKDRTMGDFVFSICHAVSGKSSWAHYSTLITVENEKAQQYYFYETVKRRWTVRELQRQIKEAA